MSDFSDIKRAYDSYQGTGSWGQVKRGLIYTCNGGWIDFGHLNPSSSRPTIGAENLWKQVNVEGPILTRSECQNYDMNVGYAQLRMALAGCRGQPDFRFKGGSTGYKVTYRQDHGNRTLKQKLYPSVERSYVVKHKLTPHQKRSVALAIFQDVSMKFESRQRFYGGFDFVTDSGFSQEDLVSNLIGFYIGLGLVTQSEAIRKLHPVSRDTSERLWNTNGSVGSNENHTFTPQFIDTDYRNDVKKRCENECVFQPKQLPAFFNSITRAMVGTDFLRL